MDRTSDAVLLGCTLVGQYVVLPGAMAIVIHTQVMKLCQNVGSCRSDSLANQLNQGFRISFRG